MSEDLLAMAKDASSTARRDLLHAVTDLFLASEEPSDEAKGHYSVIATQALEQISGVARAEYAAQVAAEPTLPQPVALKLARDAEIEVAHLVLKLSPVLSDEDLTAIAATHSQGHLIAIAERAAIAEITTEVLAERGSAAVLRTLSGNLGAAFSDQGMARLMERGSGHPAVLANLTRRALQRPERQAQRVLRLAAQVEAPDSKTTRETQRRQVEVNRLIADVLKGRRILDDVLVLLAQQEQAFELAVVIAAFARRTTPQVLKALFKTEADDLIALCRAIQVPSPVFETILKLRAKRLQLSQVQLALEQDAYEDGRPDRPVGRS